MGFEDRLNKRLAAQRFERLGSDIDELGAIDTSETPNPSAHVPAHPISIPSRDERTGDEYRTDVEMDKAFDREGAIAKTEQELTNPNLTPDARRLLRNKLAILKRGAQLERGRCTTCDRTPSTCRYGRLASRTS